MKTQEVLRAFSPRALLPEGGLRKIAKPSSSHWGAASMPAHARRQKCVQPDADFWLAVLSWDVTYVYLGSYGTPSRRKQANALASKRYILFCQAVGLRSLT